MGSRISVVSQKGGVGKTTVCLNLALALAERGRRTLLVDLDPQGAIGLSLAKEDTELPGVVELLMGVMTPEQAITQTQLPNLAILSRGRLDPIDICAYQRSLDQHELLEKSLAQCEKEFDIVLMDTPAGLGIVTCASLAVSQFVIAPFQAQTLSLRSVSQVLRVIEHVGDSVNPALTFLGLLPTMVDKTDEVSRDVLLTAWSEFAGVFTTTIPAASVFAKASAAGVPVAYLPGPVSPAVRHFDLLAAEVDERLAQSQLSGGPTDDRPARELL